MRDLAPTLDDMADLDPYRVLGLEPEPGLSEAVIKKAYRKKALVLHPDKRAASEREKAQREFDQLQKAYDILLDPEARAALENLAKARAASRARAEQQEAKRRKLREDLEARERAAERGKNEEEEAKERLQSELARLRRDFATRKRAYDRETAAATTPKEPAPEASAPADAAPAVPEHLYRTLKVAWRRDASNYPARRLRDIYAQFGTVEDVVIREGKKKKGSALVVFAERAAAARAATATAGDASNPLLAVPAAVPPPGWTAPERGAGEEERVEGRDTAAAAAGAGSAAAAGAPSRPPPGGGLFPGGVSGGGGLFPGGSASRTNPGGGFSVGSGGNVANRDYESVVLDRMRRAQEKARIIAEMEAAEAAEEAGG